MMNLTSTDSVRVVTSAGVDVDVFASYVDKLGTTITPGNQPTAITTATTTTVVSAPSASTQRNVNILYICNRDLTDSVTITVQFYDGTATEVISKGIGPGGVLVLDDQGQWTVVPSGLVTKQYMTTPGSATYTTPVSVTSIFIECLGGGGLGGSCITNSANSGASGGGASGEYTCLLLNNPAASYPCYIGANTGGGIAGDDGEVTIFNAVAESAERILAAHGGCFGAVDTAATIHIGGLGGSVTGDAFASLTFSRSSTPGGTGLAIANAQALSGQGGSPWMYGAGGNSRKTTGAGNSGLGYGAGGGGACILSGAANQSAGNGTGGLIIVTEFR